MARTLTLSLSRTLIVFTISALLLAGFALSAFAQSKEQTVIIGTGSPNGVYYPAGGAICRLINLKRKETGLRCLVESTSGSLYNIEALREQGINFAIVQSDWQYNAFNGKEDVCPQFKELRSVFSLHSEMFTVAVKRSAGIEKFDDLKGKRVNIGNEGSGMRAIMESLMRLKGWTHASFKEAQETKPGEAMESFCTGNLDALVFAAGNPNGVIEKLTRECDAKLIPVEGAEVDKLLKAEPYYARTMIPGGMYKNNPQNVPTFGIKATLITTSNVSDQAVYQLVKSVFENFDDFRTLHFVFANLDKERMVNAGLTAPFHDGALKYYREVGLVK